MNNTLMMMVVIVEQGQPKEAQAASSSSAQAAIGVRKNERRMKAGLRVALVRAGPRERVRFFQDGVDVWEFKRRARVGEGMGAMPLGLRYTLRYDCIDCGHFWRLCDVFDRVDTPGQFLRRFALSGPQRAVASLAKHLARALELGHADLVARWMEHEQLKDMFGSGFFMLGYYLSGDDGHVVQRQWTTSPFVPFLSASIKVRWARGIDFVLDGVRAEIAQANACGRPRVAVDLYKALVIAAGRSRAEDAVDWMDHFEAEMHPLALPDTNDERRQRDAWFSAAEIASEIVADTTVSVLHWFSGRLELPNPLSQRSFARGLHLFASAAFSTCNVQVLEYLCTRKVVQRHVRYETSIRRLGNLQAMEWMYTVLGPECLFGTGEVQNAAAASGNLEIMEWALATAASNQERFLIKTAAAHGHTPMVRYLADRGFTTPANTVEAAAQHGHLATVEELLRHPALEESGIRTHNRNLVAGLTCGDPDLVRLLLAHSTVEQLQLVLCSQRAIVYLANQGRCETLRALVEHVPAVLSAMSHTPARGPTLMDAAATGMGDVATMQFIRERFDGGIKCSKGTPYSAASAGNLGALQYLHTVGVFQPQREGAASNAGDILGTASASLSCVEWLAGPECGLVPNPGTIPHIVRNGHLDTLRYLRRRFPGVFADCTPDSLLTAIRMHRYDIVRFLHGTCACAITADHIRVARSWDGNLEQPPPGSADIRAYIMEHAGKVGTAWARLQDWVS